MHHTKQHLKKIKRYHIKEKKKGLKKEIKNVKKSMKKCIIEKRVM